MQVSVFWIKVIQGSIILVAMLIDAQRLRLRELSNIATSEKKL
jgi:predicted ABC-type sugar transport system permease subunit